MTTTMTIDPEQITPLHEVRRPALVHDLAADMIENGWQGRPLLVVERESDYLAWTGTHRIAAAKRAKLSGVPCCVLHESELLRRGFEAERGHVFASDRLKILIEIDDEDAIHLMWQEGRQ